MGEGGFLGILELFALTGKKAVVTGGARGIGRASAIALAEAGADVAVIDMLNSDETIARIEALGRNALAMQTDLRYENNVNQAFNKIKDTFGKIEIVHNNAGIVICAKSEEMSFEQWRKVMEVDLDAVFLVARAAGRHMIRDGNGGSIINTASMSGIIVNYPQEQAAYNAAKAGVISLTKSLACEWAKYGIRVNSISPGYVCTDMTPPTTDKALLDIWFSMCPTKRLATPREIAGAVVYLASDAASYVTGSNIIIDGGYTCY